ncbi:MAG: hypothetical protein HMLIMOIP_000123 [Candidatus Nitrosomirales archaeon]|jgi:hypothetical protein
MMHGLCGHTFMLVDVNHMVWQEEGDTCLSVLRTKDQLRANAQNAISTEA